MAYEERLVNVSYVASANLSAEQYRMIAIANQAGRTQAQRAVVGDRVVGVLQNNPVAGDVATIAVGGVTKCVAGGTITAGQSVTTDAAGRATATLTATDYRVGVAQESAVVGQIFALLLISFGTA